MVQVTALPGQTHNGLAVLEVTVKQATDRDGVKAVVMNNPTAKSAEIMDSPGKPTAFVMKFNTYVSSEIVQLKKWIQQLAQVSLVTSTVGGVLPPELVVKLKNALGQAARTAAAVVVGVPITDVTIIRVDLASLTLPLIATAGLSSLLAFIISMAPTTPSQPQGA